MKWVTSYRFARFSQPRRSSGFTIVELLIVIVVIGILASLVLNSFSSAQLLARNAQRVTSAKAWQKIIVLYVNQYSAYPTSMLPNHTCLNIGNPTDWDANPDEDCNTSTSVKHPNTNALIGLRKISPVLPDFPTQQLAINGTAKSVGIAVRAMDIFDPLGTPKSGFPTLQYWLEGNNQNCVLGPILIKVSGGINTGVGVINSGNDGPSTYCMIGLPDPAGL